MAIFQKPFGKNGGNSYGDEKSGDIGGIRAITEKHIACVLLLDTSGSMKENDAIGKLNQGLRQWKSDAMSSSALDGNTMACIDVAIVSFGPDVKVIQGFAPLDEMSTPTLSAYGGTPMGGAINLALDMITEQKARYNELGTPYYRPWLYCLTDGEPTDDEFSGAVRRLKQMEAEKRVVSYGVGVEEFNRTRLSETFSHTYQLDNLNFGALFEFLSNSFAMVTGSDPGTTSATLEAPKDLHKIDIEF